MSTESRPTARDAVLRSIRTLFPTYAGAIADDLRAQDIPEWDSVAHVQLMFLIEEQSGRLVDIGATFAIADVGALIDYVAQCPDVDGSGDDL